MAKKTQARHETKGDTPDQSAIVRGKINRRVEVSPGFVSLYANDVQIQTSPWDVRLTFGELSVEDGEGGSRTAHVKQTGEARMSPQLAKRLIMIMFQQLKTYEQRFGQIPQPKDDGSEAEN